MENLVGVGTSALSGGVFGLLGTALGRLIGVWENRQTLGHERARWAHEIKLHELQLQAGAAETERELAVLAASGSFAGLEESLRAETSLNSSYKWVDAVRALVRPVLTSTLWALYLFVFVMISNGNVEAYLDAEAARDLVGYFIANVAFAATAATLWWFGDRAPKPGGREPWATE